MKETGAADTKRLSVLERMRVYFMRERKTEREERENLPGAADTKRLSVLERMRKKPFQLLLLQVI